MRNFLLLLLLIGIPSAQAETVELRFDELPQWVGEGNRDVHAGEAFVEEARSQTGHYRRSYIPRVEATVGGEAGKTGTFDATLEPFGEIETRVNVFRGGKDRLEEKARAGQVELSEANKGKRYLEALSRARLLFAEALYFQENLKGLPRISAAAREQLGKVQKQVAAGLAPESDRLGFEMYLNTLKSDILLQQEDYEHALEELKAVLGIPPETKLSLSHGFSGALAEDLLKLPLNADNNQEIVALKKQVEILGVKKSQEDRWWTPVVDVYGGYALYTFRQIQFESIDERKAAYGGVNLAFQVFDGLEAKTRKKALEYQAKGYALEAEQKRRELAALHEKLQHELVNRRKLMALSDRNIQLGSKSLTMASDEYVRGIKSGPQLLETLQRYWGERRRMTDLRKEYLQIQAQLLALLGK